MVKTVVQLNNPKRDLTKLLNFNPIKQFELSKISDRWLKGELSNFEYLMEVNLYSGRSYNDLSQYPVFPWILLIDYLSDNK